MDISCLEMHSRNNQESFFLLNVFTVARARKVTQLEGKKKRFLESSLMLILHCMRLMTLNYTWGFLNVYVLVEVVAVILS